MTSSIWVSERLPPCGSCPVGSRCLSGFLAACIFGVDLLPLSPFPCELACWYSCHASFKGGLFSFSRSSCFLQVSSRSDDIKMVGTRKLGSQGFQASELGLGCMSLTDGRLGIVFSCPQSSAATRYAQSQRYHRLASLLCLHRLTLACRTVLQYNLYYSCLVQLCYMPSCNFSSA